MATQKYELRSFEDIIDAVCEEIGIQSDDSVTRNRIKRDINTVYKQEVIPAARWRWLREQIDVQHPTYFATGSASVSTGSQTVTISQAPTRSYKDAWFSVDSQSSRYRIKSHSANGTSIVLENEYEGSTSAIATYKLWFDTISLPPTAKEVIEVTHDHITVPMQGQGVQQFRKTVAVSPKAQGRPLYYSTGEFVDPDPYDSITGLPASATRASSELIKTIKFASSLGDSISNLKLQVGDQIKVSGCSQEDFNSESIVLELSTTDNTNDTIKYIGMSRRTLTSTADTGLTVEKRNASSYGERYRELLLWPALYTYPTTLHIDILKEAPELVEDSDEPLIPVEDRIVLLYGALSRGWVKQRNPESAAENRSLYNEKLARMMGNGEDTPELPQFRPSSQYLGAKRRSRRTRGVSPINSSFEGLGSSGTNVPQGTPNTVAIFGSDGRLTGSAAISTTELGYLDGADSNIQDQLDGLGLVSPVGNRVLESDSAGAISESNITSDELDYLDDSIKLSSVTLTDNTSSPLAALSFAVASFDSVAIQYSLRRDTAREMGVIHLSSDGTSAAISQGAIASLGTMGVTFTADISGGNLRLLYTTTSTGNNATLKYKLHKWISS